MKNPSLLQDYLKRCQARLKSIDTLYAEKDWPDVVRESQEVVELALKSLLRYAHIDVPRIHDVSEILTQHKASFSSVLQKQIPQMGRISKTLRRDRELAFYGSEDLTPSDFYSEDDAKEARNNARWVVGKVLLACKI